MSVAQAGCYNDDLVRLLLFGGGRCDAGWLAEFEEFAGRCDDWQPRCDQIVAEHYASNPGATDGFARLAWFLFSRGESELAMEYFAKDMHPPRIGWWLWLRYAEALALSGDIESAFGEVEQVYSWFHEARNGYASLAWRLRDTCPVEKLLCWVHKDECRGRLTSGFAINHAELLARAGRWADAITRAELAQATEPELHGGFARLAQAAYKLQDPEMAATLLERVTQESRVSAHWQRERDWLSAKLHSSLEPSAVSGYWALIEDQLLALANNDHCDGAEAIRSLCAQAARDGCADETITVLAHGVGDGDGLVAGLSWGLVAATVVGIDPHVRWHQSMCSADSMNWLSSAGRRIQQALVDCTVCPTVFDQLSSRRIAACLDRSRQIAKIMRGRPCGVVGDRLAQYGAVLQRCSEKEGSIRVLEIGVLFGGSSLMFLSAAEDVGASMSVICVDPLDGYYGQPNDPVSGEAVSPATLYENLARLGFSSDAIQLRRCFSEDEQAIQGIEAKSIDVLLIDGDHSLEGVLADWRRFNGAVAVGGFVIFDDYGIDHPGVKQAVHEILNEGAIWRPLGCLGTSFAVQRIEPPLD